MTTSDRKRMPGARAKLVVPPRQHVPVENHKYRLAWTAVALLAGIASCFLGTRTPPFQSPDEYAHVSMAYLLSHGQLRPVPGQDGTSGGAMDTAFIKYMALYSEDQFSRGGRISSTTRASAESLQWSGVREHAPGGVIYLPLAYLPQAVALRMGEVTGLSVAASYRMARIASAGAATLLFMLAFWLYRPAPLAAAIVVLPMTLFQISSASIDGVTTAMALVAVSAYLRIWTDHGNAPRYAFGLLLAMLVITVPTRPYLLPLFCLPLMCAWKRQKWSYVAWTVVAAAVPVMWLLPLFYPSDVPLPTPARAPLWEIIGYYIENPSRVPAVVVATARHAPTTTLYFHSFIGLLGWLDTKFMPYEYQLLSVMLLIVLALTVSPRCMMSMRMASITLALCGVVTLALVFVALWLFWSPHPAVIIRGVQGRYFAIPLMLVAYALCPNQDARLPAIRWIGLALVTLLLGMATVMTAELLQRRHTGYFATAFTAGSHPVEVSVAISKATRATTP